MSGNTFCFVCQSLYAFLVVRDYPPDIIIELGLLLIEQNAYYKRLMLGLLKSVF